MAADMFGRCGTLGLSFAVATASSLYACSWSREESHEADAVALTAGGVERVGEEQDRAARYCRVELPDSWRTALATGVQRHGSGESGGARRIQIGATLQ